MHRHEALVRGALDLLDGNDIDGYVDCFTEDVTLVNPLGVATGRAEFRDYHATFESFSHHFRRVERILVSDESVAVWLTFGGSVAATGRSFEVEGCGIFTVRGDKLCALTEYVDVGPILAAYSSEG